MAIENSTKPKGLSQAGMMQIGSGLASLGQGFASLVCTS
jgi:hypothetical protein